MFYTLPQHTIQVNSKFERKNQQKSINESKSFKISIDEYEKDIEAESAKGKKNEILDLLNNHNKLRSEEEFNEIKENLHYAIKEGDIDLIKIYLSETIVNDSNTLKFKIDETNRTASLFRVNNDIEEFIVPRIVKHESNEYLINSISGTMFCLRTLKFVEDSAVKTLYRYVFPIQSTIKEIYFPTSLKELKEGWCSCAENLTKITISPSNSQFKIQEDKYLIGKSDSNKDEFDILFFAYRDIKEISIPSNIKIISSYAFQFCKNLTKVEIPTNSNLQTIESCAFEYSGIKEIFIPSKVSIIRYSAFSGCDELIKIEFAPNSNLQTIESFAFEESRIKEVSIPSTVIKICNYAFSSCYSLIKVEIPTNSNLQTIKSKAFSHTNIKNMFIPSKVSEICDNAFFWCFNLQIIEISEDSKLESFPLSAFDNDSKLRIMIPSPLKRLIQT